MAQFVLKIEKLSHIMGTAPIVELARLRSLSPIMAPGLGRDIKLNRVWLFGPAMVLFKGARSRYFRSFCLILVVMNSKLQIGRLRVFHLQNHGPITNDNDFPAR